MPVARHDGRLRNVQSRVLLASKYGGFPNAGMFDQRALDFNRRDPLAGYSKHVVRSTGVPIVAIVIDSIFVSREKPATAHAVLRQSAAIPVALRRAGT